jgi:hypothetical protein
MFRVVTHDEYDGACEAELRDGFEGIEPIRVNRSMCETTCGSDEEIFDVYFNNKKNLTSHLIRDSNKNRTKKQVSTKWIFNLNLRT